MTTQINEDIFLSFLWSVVSQIEDQVEKKKTLIQDLFSFFQNHGYNFEIKHPNFDSIDKYDSLNLLYKNCYNSNEGQSFIQSGRYLKEFDELKKMGSGGFGSVYKVKSKFDDQIYAVKKISNC